MMNRQHASTATYYYPPYAQHPPPLAQHYHDPSFGGALLYRPLQLPPQTQYQQHPLHLSANQQQQQQQQHQFSLTAAADFQHPTLPHQYHQAVATLPRRTRAQSRQYQAAMAFQQNQQACDDELAQMQKLSNEYEPEVTGPLVGQRLPSTALTTEYASADPVYQAKTTTLPQKYSYYRTVRGDGKCGWRAVAFGYFETLVRFGDSGKFLEEETRLRSLNNVIAQAGYDLDIMEDFANEAYVLLRDLATSIVSQDGRADHILFERFNDEETQNYLITFLRTLTAAWMRTREAEYAPWLMTQTVEQYCELNVLPISTEIEHVGLSALKDVLLSPAGITLEVLYLDRSEGNEATMHRFDPIHNNSYSTGSVRLLYRPGHYDMLYKPEDLPAPPPPPLPAAMPTYLQYASQPHHEPVYDLEVSDFMTMIPGMSYANPTQGWASSGFGNSADLFAPTPVQTCSPVVPTPTVPAPPTQVQAQPIYAPVHAAIAMAPPPVQMPQELVIRTVPHSMTLTQAHNSFHDQLSGPFRPSAYELDPNFVEATSHTPFQTSIFRNSHFNQAHFLNPDFQPEQWDPEDEYANVTNISKVMRHKSTG